MPAVPEAPTIYDGIVPSSTWNQFRDAIRFLQQKPIAQLRQTTLQTLTTNTYTPIAFQAEGFDLDPDNVGGHDNVTNNTRWTCRYPGYHLVSGMVVFADNGTGARQAGLRVNGVDISGSYMSVPPIAGNVSGVACKTMRVFLDIGHFVELIGYHTRGSNLDTYVASAPYQSGLSIGWDRVQ